MTSAALPVVRCYACGGDVPRELEGCPSCGASQDAGAKALWQQVRHAKRQQDLWRFLAVLGILVGIVIGVAWAGLGDARPTATAGRPAAEPGAPSLGSAEVPPAEVVNDMFVRLINAEMRRRGGAPFEILAWLPLQPDGILLEVRPPTAQDPLTQWQLLDAKGREAMMQFLTVTLLRAQIEAGTFVEGSRPFPPMVLQYRGDPEPLAIRHPDGRIEVRPTRWDAAYAEFFKDLEQKAGAAPPPSAARP